MEWNWERLWCEMLEIVCLSGCQMQNSAHNLIICREWGRTIRAFVIHVTSGICRLVGSLIPNPIQPLSNQLSIHPHEFPRKTKKRLSDATYLWSTRDKSMCRLHFCSTLESFKPIFGFVSLGEAIWCRHQRTLQISLFPDRNLPAP